MSQSQMIQAAITVEAAQEFGKLVRPVVQRIVRKARSLRPEANVTANPQPTVVAQRPEGGPLGAAQAQES
jgi:hypothetical protein